MAWTVRELREALKKHPDDAVVVLETDDDSHYYPLKEITSISGVRAIYLFGEPVDHATWLHGEKR